MYNRLLSLAEFQYNLVVTASHIAGKHNVMAVAGSRAWDTDHAFTGKWTNMSYSWSQVQLESPFDKLSDVWDRCCVKPPWHTLPQLRIPITGTNGVASPTKWGGLDGSPLQQLLNGWHTSPHTAGSVDGMHAAAETLFHYQAQTRMYPMVHRRYKNLALPSSPKIDLLLQGIKRLSAPRRKKQPLTRPFLRVLYRFLDISKQRQRLLLGGVITGYFFLLRLSEFLKINNTRRFFCLKTSNAFFSDDNGRRVSRNLATSVTIGLEGAKNDQFGRCAWRTMSASGDKLLCPLKGLHHIFRARQLLNMESDKHFCASLTATEVVNAIKNTARRIGVPAARYSSHSIRIGGATALATDGANKVSIKFLGRWLSNCYGEYPRLDATQSKRHRDKLFDESTHHTWQSNKICYGAVLWLRFAVCSTGPLRWSSTLGTRHARAGRVPCVGHS